MVAALVTLGTLVGTVGCVSQPAPNGLKANEWTVGEPSRIGGTDLTSTGLLTLQSGRTRSATIFAPTDRAEGERLPAVIVLHGLGYSAYDAMVSGNWLAQLEADHLVGVFPEGVDHSWNAGSCCKPSNVTVVDDVGFLTSLTTLLQQRDDIDPSRIYMVGFSNGGMMMYRFLCTHADMLAGGASVAGTSVAHCLPSASIPLMHVAGTADTVIPYAGGYSNALVAFGGGQVAPADDAFAAIAGSDGCAPHPDVTDDGGVVKVEQWEGCANGTAHELVTLRGFGHAWPTAGPFDATPEILHFLGLDAITPPPTTTTTTTEDPTTTTTTTEDPTTTTTTTEDPTTTTTIE
jgi:polyhydroxybutyrate depolymerase